MPIGTDVTPLGVTSPLQQHSGTIQSVLLLGPKGLLLLLFVMLFKDALISVMV